MSSKFTDHIYWKDHRFYKYFYIFVWVKDERFFLNLKIVSIVISSNWSFLISPIIRD